MESRVCNIDLPGYTSEHAFRQLRASIACAREFIIDVAFADRRGFFGMCERVFRFARYRKQARTLVDEYDVDPMDAVPRDVSADVDVFYSRRLPQMLAILAADRDRRRRSEARRKVQRDTKRTPTGPPSNREGTNAVEGESLPYSARGPGRGSQGPP
jgi:hypothetical protein